MFWRFLTKQRQRSWSTTPERQASSGLQITLWIAWSLMVVTVGYVRWHADLASQQPLNTIGLAIHCSVAGLIGLIVMTVIEMHMEPWRFVDEDE